MDRNIFPSSSLFSVIFLLFSLPLPKYLEAYYESDSICTNSFDCGKIKGIGYPFWRNGVPEYCGHPNFKLDCDEDDATINITSQKYSVVEIDLQTQILKIARTDLLDNICHDQFVNTTLNFNLFDYTSHVENATLFYGCSQRMELLNISCPTNGDFRYGYFVSDSDTNLTNELSRRCKVSVVVPILRIWDLFSNSSNISTILSTGFEVRWVVDQGQCRDCVNSGGICGYNWTWDGPFCFCPHQHQPSNRSCPSSDLISATSPVSLNAVPNDKVDLRRKLIIGAISGGIGLLLVSIIFWCTTSKTSSYRSIIFWREKIIDNRNLEDFIKKYGSLSPKRYTYSDVKKMTNSFRDKLGQGGYGCVYRAKLLDNRLAAVKLLDESKGNGEEFINEVASIGRTAHVNVVSLLGFCVEGRKRALIYEFMPNGSLEKFIYGEGLMKTNGHLGWEKLFQISIGIARGLEYLHRGCNQRILHFDIKPHNILLDEDFCPKISDFGLAKLCTKKESIISMLDARGTIGYIAPEVVSRNFGQVSHKSDVYSYGMMVLEMVGGRKNVDVDVGTSHTSKIYFPHWVYKRIELNEELGFQGDITEEENEMAKKMILVGLWCIQTYPSQRPPMSKVVEMLEGSIEALEIPPKPYLYSASTSPAQSCTT